MYVSEGFLMVMVGSAIVLAGISPVLLIYWLIKDSKVEKLW